jgi:hypothetical protein
MFVIWLLLNKNLSDFRLPPAMLIRSALFWDITRRRVVIVYRRFGLLTREDGTDTLSRKVGEQLPHDAA